MQGGIERRNESGAILRGVEKMQTRRGDAAKRLKNLRQGRDAAGYRRGKFSKLRRKESSIGEDWEEYLLLLKNKRRARGTLTAGHRCGNQSDLR